MDEEKIEKARLLSKFFAHKAIESVIHFFEDVSLEKREIVYNSIFQKKTLTEIETLRFGISLQILCLSSFYWSVYMTLLKKNLDLAKEILDNLYEVFIKAFDNDEILQVYGLNKDFFGENIEEKIIKGPNFKDFLIDSEERKEVIIKIIPKDKLEKYLSSNTFSVVTSLRTLVWVLVDVRVPKYCLAFSERMKEFIEKKEWSFMVDPVVKLFFKQMTGREIDFFRPEIMLMNAVMVTITWGWINFATRSLKEI